MESLTVPLIDSCLICRNWLWAPGYWCSSCDEIFEGLALNHRYDRGLDIFSLLQFVKPADELIRIGKNRRAHDLLAKLAHSAGQKLATECLWPITGVIPMPPKVPGARDHAYVIGETVANFFRVPLCPQFLRRASDGVHQKEKSRGERHEIKIERAVDGLEDVELEGLLLLVDDVVTTGATLHQAWSVLGKPQAVALTLASTPLWFGI